MGILLHLAYLLSRIADNVNIYLTRWINNYLRFLVKMHLTLTIVLFDIATDYLYIIINLDFIYLICHTSPHHNSYVSSLITKNKRGELPRPGIILEFIQIPLAY